MAGKKRVRLIVSVVLGIGVVLGTYFGITVTRNVLRLLTQHDVKSTISLVHSLEIAATKILVDSKRKDFRDFFHPDDRAAYNALDLAGQVYVCSYAMHRLAPHGRNAISEPDDWDIPQIRLDPEALDMLGVSYLDEAAVDAWGEPLQVWFGPWRGAVIAGTKMSKDASPILFRSWRPNPDSDRPYIYDENAHTEAEEQSPGAPPPDNLPGFPAPAKLHLYIFSEGKNRVTDQAFGAPAPGYEGGGDDIPNWEKRAGRWYGAR